MTDFRKHAECVKLARLLHCNPAQLTFLETLDAAALRRLNQSCRRYLLEEHRVLFQRISVASKLLPNALIAFMAERALGPLLCARVAGEMSTQRAIEIARHLSHDFLASTAVHLETTRTSELTLALPLPHVLAVSHELVKRREFILMGNLVSTLPTFLIETILRNIHDGEALLRIAFFVENSGRLDDILDVLPTGHLRSVINAAADENTDLWPEALALMSVVAPHWQARLVNMAVDEDEDTLSSMVRGVVKHDLWHAILPLLRLMTEANRRRVINLPAVQDDAVLGKLLDAATRYDLWQYTLPLVPLMSTEMRQRAARLTDDSLSPVTLGHLIHVCHMHRLWPAALLLVADMSDERRAQVSALIAESNDELVSSFIDSVREQQLWQLALPMIAAMSETARQHLVSLPAFQNEALLHDVVAATRQYGLWSLLLSLTGLMPEKERRSIARIAETFDAAAIRELSDSISSTRQWLTALELISFMRPERRTTIALQVAEQDDDVLHDLLHSLEDSGQWQQLLDLLTEIPEYAQHQLLNRARELDAKLRLKLLIAADREGRCDTVLLRLAELPPEEKADHIAVFHNLPEQHLSSLRNRCHELGLKALLD